MAVFTTAVRCFQEVARRGSIRRAAQHLNLTPSAVNRQILGLEGELATALFERVPRGVRLTAAGEILLLMVRRQERELQVTLSQIEELRGLKQGHVVLASLQYLAQYSLTQFIARFQRSHPGLTFTLLTGSSAEVTQLVVDGAADIGICYGPGQGLPIQTMKAIPVQFGAAMAVTHPLAARSQLYLRDCLLYPVVLPIAGMESRLFVEQLGLSKWPDRLVVAETSSFGALIEMLKAGIGIGFLSAFDAALEVRRGTLSFVPLLDVFESRPPQICTLIKGNRTLPFATALVLERLSQHLDHVDRLEALTDVSATASFPTDSV